MTKYEYLPYYMIRYNETNEIIYVRDVIFNAGGENNGQKI